jgi:DHA2 family multidrug resistance protein
VSQKQVNPWVIALTVTLATFMEVLDTSIANVALPHISGSLGASQDESTWIISSYLVANAVVLPVSAYMTNLLGRKRFYMLCVAIFWASSLLCGLAPTLPVLLFSRVLQGAGGGGLGPSEQAILADTFPPEKRGQAFALYGFAVVLAPTLGPTLGGWITDNYDWRWIFFINLPVALLSLFLVNRLIEDPPSIKKEVEAARKGKFSFDYLGFGLVALAFGSLEVLLDKGQEDDWFGSTFIRLFFTLFVTGFIGFVIWEIRCIRQKKKPILDLRLLLNRNLSVSMVLMFMVGLALYSCLTMLPQLLQSEMGYTAQLAGEAMSLGGFATLCCMALVGALVAKTDARYMVLFGFVVMGFALLYSTTLNLQMSFGYASKLRIYQSLGLSFLFIPVNTLSYIGVKPEQNNDVSGLINLARNIGGSCGTSLFTTLLARFEQMNQHNLSQHTNPGNPGYAARLNALTQHAMASASSLADAQHRALGQIYHQLHQQAAVLSYIDILSLLAVLAFAVAPLPLILKRPPKGGTIAAH